MSAIDHALSDLLWGGIPRELLEAAFLENDTAYYHSGVRRVLNVSLADAIRTKVIDAKVRRDCDAVGGTQVIIPLRGVEFIKHDHFTTTFRVPMTLTGGRVITSILAVMYGFPDTLFGAPGNGIGAYSGAYNPGCGNGAFQQGMQSMLQSYSPAPEIQLTNVAIIGQNQICIYETQMVTNQLTLRCVVTNDPELNNIPARSYPKFAKLVRYAVQAYIYNKLNIKVDQGQLVGGMELGAFKDTLQTYSDSLQNYDDYLKETWTKTAAFADKLRKHRAIRMMTPKR
ncbi:MULTISPECIES: DUF7484 family protein [Proteus]|uniref:DUF7484 family protein n=1 Tax=Proteus TaxID=583 RepID=UPI0015F1E913|nr:hypothetical protein [Proteus columbae]QMP24133.1 hypothetical protein [Proteus phage 10]